MVILVSFQLILLINKRKKLRISTFTTMTNPEERNDPWKEALSCYESFSDEVVVVGNDWPKEFKFDLIGKFYQKGFDKSSGDWVLRMDIDYFFHEKNLDRIRTYLSKNSDAPAISFPQYQFFTPERYQIKTRLCIAINKKKFPNVKFNGGGDLCLPTIDGAIINPRKMPNINVPIYQYDSLFRTQDMISEDRARFARAWFKQFNEYGDRGGPSPEEAFEAWFEVVKSKYRYHVHKIKIDDHPNYIIKNLQDLSQNQFGFDAFGLKDITKRPLINYLKGYREKYINSYTNNLF